MSATHGFTPFTEPEIVQAYLQSVLERLGITFHHACLEAKLAFTQRGWSRDAALSAFLVRKEVLEDLKRAGLQVEADDVEIERKALCGLLLTLPLVHLKIRKSKDGEIPPAGSAQAASFYNWNLLVFPQTSADEVLPLHLMLLWNDNAEGELETLLLACVEGNTWRWRLPVFQRNSGELSRKRDERTEPTDFAAEVTQQYEEAFDSANEDVPLSLKEEPTPTPETTVDSTETENTALQENRRKKAK